MKKNYVILAFLLLIIIVAAVTNPNETIHKETVKGKLAAYLNSKVGETGGGLGQVFATAMIQRTVDTIVSRDNYLLFSLTKLKWQGDEKVIGIGLFGNVLTFGKINELANAGT